MYAYILCICMYVCMYVMYVCMSCMYDVYVLYVCVLKSMYSTAVLGIKSIFSYTE
jgi:hypothetical protein